ncbi:excalibur calcium-binding domain-containing protein [Winogradskya consettensis]|nr:excalibur calcium-binding domain-containing protein [Actinoplanes consettensis]
MVTPAQPWQLPVPPPAKRKKWPIIVGASVLGVLLCCGGVTAIGLAAGDPAKKDTADSKLIGAPSSATAGPDTPVSTETASPTASSAESESESESTTSKPAGTAGPKPKPAVTNPQPRPTTTRPTTQRPTTQRPTTKKPTTKKPTTNKPTTQKPTTKKPTTKPKTKKPTAEVYYANCAAVRAAGADPIYAGDPGYSRKLDRDGDGVACE